MKQPSDWPVFFQAAGFVILATLVYLCLPEGGQTFVFVFVLVWNAERWFELEMDRRWAEYWRWFKRTFK